MQLAMCLYKAERHFVGTVRGGALNPDGTNKIAAKVGPEPSTAITVLLRA
jgi:hypothetical protein